MGNMLTCKEEGGNNRTPRLIYLFDSFFSQHFFFFSVFSILGLYVLCLFNIIMIL